MASKSSTEPVADGLAFRDLTVTQLIRSPDFDPGQTVEAVAVGRDDGSPRGLRRCRDDQVVGTSRPATLANRDEQSGVHPGDVEVVAQDWKTRNHIIKECSTCLSTFAGGDVDANAEFSDRDCSNGGLVVIADQRFQIERRSLRFDEDVGVEQEGGQNRSSATRSLRIAATSSAQSASIR